MQNNKNIFNSTFILKISRPASYITFILKEIYDYLNLKAEDGTPIISLKRIKNEMIKIKEKVYKIKNFVNS